MKFLSSVINLDVFFSLTICIYILLKTLEGSNFYLFYKLNQSILLRDKHVESLLLVFHYCENLCWSYFSLQTFFIVYRFTAKFVLDNVGDFLKHFFIISQTINTSIIKKSNKKHRLSFIKISSICTYFCKKYA